MNESRKHYPCLDYCSSSFSHRMCINSLCVHQASLSLLAIRLPLSLHPSIPSSSYSQSVLSIRFFSHLQIPNPHIYLLPSPSKYFFTTKQQHPYPKPTNRQQSSEPASHMLLRPKSHCSLHRLDARWHCPRYLQLLLKWLSSRHCWRWKMRCFRRCWRYFRRCWRWR